MEYGIIGGSDARTTYYSLTPGSALRLVLPGTCLLHKYDKYLVLCVTTGLGTLPLAGPFAIAVTGVYRTLRRRHKGGRLFLTEQEGGMDYMSCVTNAHPRLCYAIRRVASLSLEHLSAARGLGQRGALLRADMAPVLLYCSILASNT